MTRPLSIARYEQTTGHHTPDGNHATRDITCQRCHDRRQFWAWVNPDPTGRADGRVEKMAAAWLATHPCQATIYAHPRKMTRGVAA